MAASRKRAPPRSEHQVQVLVNETCATLNALTLRLVCEA